MDKTVSLSEQKKLLRQLLGVAKFSKNTQELLKYVPMLKISIQEAEIRQKKTRRQKLQLELFPNEEQNIDYSGISLWIKRNLYDV
jgi:DNA polymerase III sliding clamp (beta) subunit (PCNA family)